MATGSYAGCVGDRGTRAVSGHDVWGEAVTCTHETLRTLGPCPICSGLRFGDYRSVLADVGEVGALISDPPYGERTHRGHDRAEQYDDAERRKLEYTAWTPDHVHEFARLWAPRLTGWSAIMSCDSLAPHWRKAMEDHNRQGFAPIPCVIRGMTVRRQGDGPSSWCVWLNVSRPRSKAFIGGWTRDGAYVGGRGIRDGEQHIGGKPLWLMSRIVKDYTRPGDLVVDPCAGYGTTGVAALGLGRRFVGAEVDAATHAAGLRRLATGDHAGRVQRALEHEARNTRAPRDVDPT